MKNSDKTAVDAAAAGINDINTETAVTTTIDPIKSFISAYKTPITTTLLTISFSTFIYSTLKRTRGTRDFGFANLVKQPFLRGNIQHAAWIWAFRAFMLSTSIVGLGMTGLVVSLSYYYNVSNVKEFAIEFRKSIKRRYPNLVPEQISDEREEKAMTEFMKEIVTDLDQDRQDTEQEQMVTGTMKSVFGQ
jgi:hypothetical protein